MSASGLAWQAFLKKAEVKLELLTRTDMLLTAEKGIRGRICHAIHVIIPYAFRCKQFVWIGNASKTSCKWF